MAFIKWNDTFLVNVTEIDTQHQRLVELINDLHDAMSQGRGKEALGQVLDGLIAYTRTHFATEERLMASYHYPAAPQHKSEHDALTKKVVDLQQQFHAGEVGLTLPVMSFLKEWLFKHILEVDKLFGAFLNGKGVK